MLEINEVRKGILSVIEKNSRIDIKELSILLGISEIEVANAIADMEKEHIICGYHTMINWENTTEEKVTAMIRVPDFGEDKYFLCMATKNGVIKRTELDAYKNIRKSGIIAINLDEDDELAWVWLTHGNDDIFVATRNGMGIRFNENDARPIGRTARIWQ